VSPGTVVTDMATVTQPAGGPVPTGTVTYTLVGPNPNAGCTAPIVGSPSTTPVGSPSGPFTVNGAGTYNFIATYSGDASYAPITTPVGCGVAAEMFTVGNAVTTTTTSTAPPSTTTTLASAPTGSASATDPTGDNDPGLDPRGDLVRVGADYGSSVVLSATVATPTDPRSDPNWLRTNSSTGVLWFIDTNLDGVEDFVAGLTSVPDDPLFSRVLKVTNGALTATPCTPTGSFSAGQLKTTFDPSCIGSPKSFQMGVGMLYETTAASSVDVVPESGFFCCLVTQALASAPTTGPSGPGSTLGRTLPRTGTDSLPLTLVSLGLVISGWTFSRRGRRRRKLAPVKGFTFGDS